LRLWDSTLTDHASALDTAWQQQFGANSVLDCQTAHNQIVVNVPSSYVLPAPTTDQTTTGNAISQEIVTDSWQMIFAADQATFDNLWSTMVANCKGLGFDDMLALATQQAADGKAAQDAFMANYNAMNGN